MKERPIIFSGEMVRAILDERKTQTRRVIKPQPILGKPWRDWVIDPEMVDLPIAYCSYGIPGDRLWVRETFQYHIDKDYIWYRADNTLWVKSLYGGMHQVPQKPPRPPEWRPSIHMPRWASRIILEVTGVRVERVQEISLRDVNLEGNLDGVQWHFDWFRDLWNSINAKRGYGWDVNPWVWVVEFRKL